MATKLSICSSASLLLGHRPITAFDGSTDVARLSDALFDSTRDSALRSHPWNCATKRVSITADATAPTFDYQYRFAIPSDYVRILQVGELGFEEDYVIEAGWILANVDPILVRYIYKNTDPSTYDPLLVEALEYAMAAKMAFPLTGSASMQQAMENKFQQVLKRARAVDGQDNPPETMGDFYLVNARFGRTA